MQITRPNKAKSYKDLMQTFQQSKSTQLITQQKKVSRPLLLKKYQQNKQNIQTSKHQKSTFQKSSIYNNSQWIEQQVLKQKSHRNKDKRYELSYNKFISYITNLMISLTGYVPPQLLHQKLTYLQYLAALKDIKFLKQTYEPSPNDLVSELWNEFNTKHQNIGLFIIFVTKILNLKKNNQDKNQVYQHLWKKYEDLRYTRMQLLGKIRTYQNQQQYSFSPMISQRSRTLASSRSKSKTLIDRNHRQIYQKSLHHLQQYDEPKSISKNRQSLKDLACNQNLGNIRSQILYKKAKQKSSQKRIDKKSNDVEYEKSIKQLTFKPKIHLNVKQNRPKKPIQGEQDSIDRMIKGRVQRQVKKIIIQKGIPHNQKIFQKMKKSIYETINTNKSDSLDLSQLKERRQQNIPKDYKDKSQESKNNQTKGKFPLILSIQVDENTIKKLVINEGQNYKQVADKFIKQLKLSQQMYGKLIMGIENALKSTLTQIDQDSFESEYQSI